MLQIVKPIVYPASRCIGTPILQATYCRAIMQKFLISQNIGP